MDILNEAAEVIEKTKEKNVRVIYLPPMAVASINLPGDSANQALKIITDFVKANNLSEIKPDLRVFKITNAYGHTYGNEMLVSIPDYMNVPEPLIKKKFHGGQYAAYPITNLDDDENIYSVILEWIDKSEKYKFDSESFTRCEPFFHRTSNDLKELLNFNNDERIQKTKIWRV